MKQPVMLHVMRAEIKYDGKTRVAQSRIFPEFFQQVLSAFADLGFDLPVMLACENCGQFVPYSRWVHHKLEECQALSDTSTPEDRS